MFVIGALPTKSAPLRLLAMMVLERRVIVALLEIPPPFALLAELPEIVELVTLSVDEPVKFKIPPPFPEVELP